MTLATPERRKVVEGAPRPWWLSGSYDGGNTMSHHSIMRENEIGPLGRFLVYVLIGLAFLSAIYNLATGHVVSPMAFLIVFGGFVLFGVAKLSVILRKKWISFGSRRMTETMGNIYRLGYWFMVVGLLAMFL